MKKPSCVELENKLNLRHQEKSCETCRFFRVCLKESSSKTITSECLLLGRTMGINIDDRVQLIDWARGRVCDGWKQRSKTWKIDAYKNPYFEDKYFKRSTLERKRNDVLKIYYEYGKFLGEGSIKKK